MKHKNVIKYSLVSLALGAFASANAATQVEVNQLSFTELKKQFSIGDAKRSLSSSKEGLKIVKSRQDFNKTRHVRMQQTYLGVPVMGGYAIAHVKDSQASMMASGDESVSLNGQVYQNLAKDLGAPPASLHQDASKALAHEKLAYANESISDEQASVMVYVDENDKAHWAYKVSFMVTPKDGIPTRPTSIISTVDNSVFLTWDDIKTINNPIKGLGYGGNKRVGKLQYGKDYVALELTRDDEAKQCFMENNDVKVVDMDHSYYSSNKPMKFDCGEDMLIGGDTYWTGYGADGLDEINGAYSPTNDAMYAGYVIKHMYNDWYGLQVLVNNDGSPMQLVMRVHYGSSYQNAFWDGKQMTFGDGGYLMYPLVSLGVGAHEISHGFTEQNSSLAYYGQSGGMNESFSDMAAQAAEFYSLGEASWYIGERIMKEEQGYYALRYMDKPSRDGRSIDTADDYYNGLDVHYSSGVYNRLFYLMATQDGWDARKAFDVMVKANQDYWTPNSSFKAGACGVINATRDFNYDVDGVKAQLSKVAIDFSNCETA